MIQDIAPHTFDNSFKQIKPSSKDFVLSFQGKTSLTKSKEDFIQCPTFQDLSIDTKNAIYLFSIDDHPYFFFFDVPEQNGFTYQPLRPVTKSQPDYFGFAYATGFHLYDWYRNRIYCGRCQTKLQPGTTERSLVCPNCGVIEYPRIFPAVIIAVTHKDQILLAQYPHMKKQVLLAGFVEIGETLEETVAREVYEEVGLKVKNIRYYKSQPWGIVSDVLAGFYCELDSKKEIRLDTNELKCAYWISRDELRYGKENLDGSLTSEMIYQFKMDTYR